MTTKRAVLRRPEKPLVEQLVNKGLSQEQAKSLAALAEALESTDDKARTLAEWAQA